MKQPKSISLVVSLNHSDKMIELNLNKLKYKSNQLKMKYGLIPYFTFFNHLGNPNTKKLIDGKFKNENKIIIDADETELSKWQMIKIASEKTYTDLILFADTSISFPFTKFDEMISKFQSMNTICFLNESPIIHATNLWNYIKKLIKKSSKKIQPQESKVILMSKNAIKDLMSKTRLPYINFDTEISIVAKNAGYSVTTLESETDLQSTYEVNLKEKIRNILSYSKIRANNFFGLYL